VDSLLWWASCHWKLGSSSSAGIHCFDGLPGWLDGLEGIDVERRIRRWRDIDPSVPQAKQPKKKLDFLGLDERFDSPHGAFAAGALAYEGAGRNGTLLSGKFDSFDLVSAS
jgi:hypothetical protein